uniref:Uncharacterized protein n=1 Tax=Mycena chlorophos TaxID=658473 RepID=A0ABQ0L7V0_MYCCL|nr:predicted protein [Mycena chlorophos]
MAYRLECRDNADHRARAAQKYLDFDNVEQISGAWSGIVKRNEKIEATKEFIKSFTVTWEATQTNYTHSTTIYAYRRATPPTFMRFPGRQSLLPGFDQICTISGDLTRCFRATRAQNTAQGVRVKILVFEVCLTLGDTEISARMRWKVGADYSYGPATVAYD